MTKTDLVGTTQQLTEELLRLMGTTDSTVEATQTGEGEETSVEVNINTESETGLLIGAHGATLNAIQVFLGMALRQVTGDWTRVAVNVGDWKEKQEEALKALADQAASRARQTNEEQRLYNLSSGQRRIIHMLLSEEEDIETVSEGEGEERYLIVRAKTN